MVPFFFYLLLGISQGILEWLPVSSEGMLLLLQTAYGIPSDLALKIALWLHLGTLAAVVVAFPEEWRSILFEWHRPVPERRFLILSTVGTAVVGIPVRIFLVKLLGESALGAIIVYFIVGLALIVTGGLLKYSRSLKLETRPLSEIGMRGEFLAGLAQGFTIIPGISRSGTTVSALLLLRVDGSDSFRGSFLMSVPAVLGAVVLELLDIFSENQSLVSEINFVYLIGAIMAAFILGLLTIKFLIKVAHDFNFASVVLGFGVVLVLIGLSLMAFT